LVAKKTPTKSGNKKTVRKPTRRTARNSDHAIWFERARVMQAYTQALKQADAQALNLFETVASQMRSQFRFNAFLSGLIIVVSISILVLSLFILFFVDKPSDHLLRFSLIGVPLSFFALVLILFRNPILQARHLLESVLKLNVVFISFIRRVQQSDLLLQSMLYEKETVELDKLYLWMQEFQDISDQTQDEITRTKQV
jgi:hypothetical protein